MFGKVTVPKHEARLCDFLGAALDVLAYLQAHYQLMLRRSLSAADYSTACLSAMESLGQKLGQILPRLLRAGAAA